MWYLSSFNNKTLQGNYVPRIQQRRPTTKSLIISRIHSLSIKYKAKIKKQGHPTPNWKYITTREATGNYIYASKNNHSLTIIWQKKHILSKTNSF